ncbi:hypothetical protein LCGC14_1001410 [marine sediment metagenome]|uniref:Uncharacterized protein n=1 Tax=marine sediment metagenome TaxID=412755 RepID=A0A0F9R909_9ZZZZ
MNRSSPHTVAHRRSLAYKMFEKAANGRDLFLGREHKGDFLPTMQKYFTGISLRRYLLLVCIEYPLVMLASAMTWAIIPLTFCYMILRLASGVSAGTLHGFTALWSFAGFLVLTLGAMAGLLFLWSLIQTWAEKEPSSSVRWYLQRRYGGKDPDFDDFPEKFPGPIALLKKWLLSTGSGESSKITWDSGKKRAGW